MLESGGRRWKENGMSPGRDIVMATSLHNRGGYEGLAIDFVGRFSSKKDNHKTH